VIGCAPSGGNSASFPFVPPLVQALSVQPTPSINFKFAWLANYLAPITYSNKRGPPIYAGPTHFKSVSNCDRGWRAFLIAKEQKVVGDSASSVDDGFLVCNGLRHPFAIPFAPVFNLNLSLLAPRPPCISFTQISWREEAILHSWLSGVYMSRRITPLPFRPCQKQKGREEFRLCGDDVVCKNGIVVNLAT
jgi:hypothetical protein